MKDFIHTPEQIREAIDHFIKHTSLVIYEVADLSICEWVKWDQFQTMKFKNEAQYPNREGILEGSTNPLARAEKKQNRTYHSITEHITNQAATLVTPYATHKVKHKAQHMLDEIEKNGGGKEKEKEPEIPQRFIDAVKAIFPKVPDDRVMPQAEALEEIERLDRFVDTGQAITLDELLPALIWAAQDEFWSANFKSCAGLRKRRDGAGSPTKWEKIYARYNAIQAKETAPYHEYND